MQPHILLRHRDLDTETEKIRDLRTYRAKVDGYRAFRKAVTEMKPEEVTQVVKASGLRGRGGAGFPSGLKWDFLPKGVYPSYVTVNGDESEPGTFKDRELLEFNPHQVIEGTAIASYAVGCHTAYMYLRGEFLEQSRILQAAIDDCNREGILGKGIFGNSYDLDIYIHLGAGAYICGEETALLESLEGKLGMPRLRPPFPAVHGLYDQPTVINNVETLANVPFILLNGPEVYKRMGTEKSPGPKIFCLSGMVKRPGNYEAELGKITFRELIFGEEYGQGLLEEDREVKGILPAGASAPILPADKLDTPLDYESVAAAGSMLGSASIIVMDSTVDIAWAAKKMITFFKHESCGKCTPCREGTYWLVQEYKRLFNKQSTVEDIDKIYDIASQMVGKCFCALGEFATSPVLSSIQHFRADYESLFGIKPKPAARPVPAKTAPAAAPAKAAPARVAADASAPAVAAGTIGPGVERAAGPVAPTRANVELGPTKSKLSPQEMERLKAAALARKAAKGGGAPPPASTAIPSESAGATIAPGAAPTGQPEAGAPPEAATAAPSAAVAAERQGEPPAEATAPAAAGTGSTKRSLSPEDLERLKAAALARKAGKKAGGES